MDSSRYFVVRVIQPGTKKTAFLGFGFEDRNDAFDFNAALIDFKTRNDEPETEGLPGISGEKVDYSLKEGQKITVGLLRKPREGSCGVW